MISGIGRDSLDIAFTSRCSRTCGEPIRSIRRQVSAAVVMTSVSAGVSGSSATTVSVVSSTGTSREKTSWRCSIACSGVTPGRRLRWRGEPNTSTRPPKSWQSRASSPRYSVVLRRTASSGWATCSPSVFARSQWSPTQSSPARAIVRRISPRWAAEMSVASAANV